MADAKREIYAIGAVACAALAFSVAGYVRAGHAPPAPAASACVDPVARAAVEQVRRDVAIAAAVAATRPAQAPPGLPPGVLPPPAPPAGALPSSNAPVGKILRYPRIQASNPAVTVVQREDGTYDVKTSDPALAGTVVTAKATRDDGQEDTLLIRVPPN